MTTEVACVPPPLSRAVETAVVVSEAELATLEPVWNTTLADSRSPNVFLTWEWIRAWLDVAADGDELRVLVVRDPSTHEVVGIAPFTLRHRPAGCPALWSELAFIGCTVTAPDHIDCIAKRGWEEPVSDVVREWLLGGDGGREWDIVRLDGAMPESPLARGLLHEGPAAAAWEIPCPYVELPETWEEYEAGLAKDFRRNLRRRQRKLERESLEPVTFEMVTEPTQAQAALLDLFRLHETVRRREGLRGGAFASDVKRRFYQRVAERFLARAWLRLHRLRVGDRAVACALCFSYGGKVWYYQTGYDPRWHEYGPGYLITGHVIRSAIAEGASEVDLLRGGHAYKYEWNAARRRILKLRVASSLTGRVVAPATHWMRAAKNGWKEWRRTS
jgi:CelD/BcsL family acetyltransferase involved in cellulose biosynthesis